MSIVACCDLCGNLLHLRSRWHNHLGVPKDAILKAFPGFSLEQEVVPPGRDWLYNECLPLGDGLDFHKLGKVEVLRHKFKRLQNRFD